MRIQLDKFLVDFVLFNVCKGNVNELARRIEIDPSDLRKKLKEMRKGHINMSVLTAVLSYILHDKTINLDELRDRFHEIMAGIDDSCPYSILIDQLVKRYRAIAACKEAADSQFMLYHFAENFVKVLRKNYCSCCNSFQFVDECPCKKFADLMVWCEVGFDPRVQP